MRTSGQVGQIESRGARSWSPRGSECLRNLKSLRQFLRCRYGTSCPDPYWATVVFPGLEHFQIRTRGICPTFSAIDADKSVDCRWHSLLMEFAVPEVRQTPQSEISATTANAARV